MSWSWGGSIPPMVTPPKPATLKRYGLSREEWLAILESQDGVCFICEKVPPNGRLCTDHHHVPKWKKMPPHQRKLYVRGLLCAYCNLRLMRKGWTLKKLERGVEYMKRYEGKQEKTCISTQPSNSSMSVGTRVGSSR